MHKVLKLFNKTHIWVSRDQEGTNEEVSGTKGKESLPFTSEQNPAHCWHLEKKKSGNTERQRCGLNIGIFMMDEGIPRNSTGKEQGLMRIGAQEKEGGRHK